MDKPLLVARLKAFTAITFRTEALNFSFGVRFCHVTVRRVWGALDLCDFLERRLRTETGERASLSGSGVRDRPSESVKLFSRGIVVENYVDGPASGATCTRVRVGIAIGHHFALFAEVPEWL